MGQLVAKLPSTDGIHVVFTGGEMRPLARLARVSPTLENATLILLVLADSTLDAWFRDLLERRMVRKEVIIRQEEIKDIRDSDP